MSESKTCETELREQDYCPRCVADINGECHHIGKCWDRNPWKRCKGKSFIERPRKPPTEPTEIDRILAESDIVAENYGFDGRQEKLAAEVRRLRDEVLLANSCIDQRADEIVKLRAELAEEKAHGWLFKKALEDITASIDGTTCRDIARAAIYPPTKKGGKDERFRLL
jgi:hypothetical protein